MNDVELLDPAAQVAAVRAVLAGLHPLDEVNTRRLVGPVLGTGPSMLVFRAAEAMEGLVRWVVGRPL